MDATRVASEVATAGTALAGLVLIYIGTLVSAFSAYDAQEKKTVKSRFVGRAWLAFVGMVLALFAVGFAIVGKWLNDNCMSSAAVCFLLAALLWAILTTVLTIREIR